MIIAVGIILVFILFKINLIFISPIIALVLIYLSYIKTPFVNFGKYGDFSYGIYIYAFPVQQFVIYYAMKSAISPIEWWLVFILSFPITLFFAVLSWHLVEKRYLKLKIKIKA